MDCQRCDSLLLDLLDGELAPTDEQSARQHVSQCAQCGRAFDRLSSARSLAKELPIVDPPAELRARLFAAAGAQRKHPAAARPRSVSRLWLELIGRFAMAPQVAMATVFVLIVAVGLWSVPRLSKRPTATGGTVISPEREAEAAPPAALSPAKPLDLAVDTRTGRIRAKPDAPQAAPGRPRAQKAAQPEAEKRTEREAPAAASRFAQPPPATPAERDADPADAMLQTARARRDAGDCAAAVKLYEQVIETQAASSATTAALAEGAACYERLGQRAQAARLLRLSAARAPADLAR